MIALNEDRAFYGVPLIEYRRGRMRKWETSLDRRCGKRIRSALLTDEDLAGRYGMNPRSKR
jgi:hypothetical protein